MKFLSWPQLEFPENRLYRVDKPQAEAQEKFKQAFDAIFTNPEFADEAPKLPEGATALDFFAIPKEVTKDLKTFLEWFEPRFRDLDEQGCAHFTKLCEASIKTIDRHPYLLMPKRGNGLGVSKQIKDQVKNGFRDAKAVLGFFRDHAEASFDEQIKPNRHSKAGAVRLSRCRVLSSVYALEFIIQTKGYETMLEHAKFLMGGPNPLSPDGLAESGLLSGLHLNKGQFNLLDDLNLDFNDPDNVILGVEETGQTFTEVSLNIDDVCLRVPKLEIGLKGGWRAYLKTKRKPEDRERALSDLFRMRMIFDDETSTEYLVKNLMSVLDKAAQKRSKPGIKIEFRENNYFTQDEIKEYFPDPVEGKSDKWRSGLVRQIELKPNKNSGANYKKISAKIYHLDEEGKELFGFEIQFMRKSEHEYQEKNEDSPAHHFGLVSRQVMEIISGDNGPLHQSEILKMLESFIVTAEKEKLFKKGFPEKLVTINRETGLQEDTEFTGGPAKRALTLFNFFLKDGTLRPVTANFPQSRTPNTKTLANSDYYFHQNIRKRILDLLDLREKSA